MNRYLVQVRCSAGPTDRERMSAAATRVRGLLAAVSGDDCSTAWTSLCGTLCGFVLRTAMPAASLHREIALRGAVRETDHILVIALGEDWSASGFEGCAGWLARGDG